MKNLKYLEHLGGLTLLYATGGALVSTAFQLLFDHHLIVYSSGMRNRKPQQEDW